MSAGVAKEWCETDRVAQRSSCEAEIRAVDEATKEILSLRYRCDDMGLPGASSPTPLFNDNRGTVDWSKGTTTKGMRHINFRDVSVREIIRDHEIDLHHINGTVNPSDIFTKEMRDTDLRDSFMMSEERFNTFVSASSVWISASCTGGISLD